MYLLKHSLNNFRNVEEAVFCPERGVNVVFGDNGQGKTNLLESIYLLTGAKSFRAKKDGELIRDEEELSVIYSEFFSEGREQNIRLTVSSRGRNARRNKGNEVKASSLAGVFRCVLFSPEHLTLIKGSPAQRRKFIDTALCQISPKYLAKLKKYSRLVEQKNGLIKSFYRTPDAFDILDVYDYQIAGESADITAMRVDFCGKMLILAKENYEIISGGGESINFCYKSTLWEDGNISFETGLEKISKLRNDDIRAGFSTLGPHRDDLLISLEGKDSRAFASQGQQRSAVLALKLAEADIMERSSGEKPLLLLDDVLSELDGFRQDYLMGRLLDGIQSVITGCDPSLVSRRAPASLFQMKSGRFVS